LTTETDIVAAFEQFISCAPWLDRLDERMLASGFTLHEGTVHFSIDALHSWIDETHKITFKQFRQALFNSQLNQRLQSLGYIVDIALSTQKVDDSIYRLRKL